MAKIIVQVGDQSEVDDIIDQLGVDVASTFDAGKVVYSFYEFEQDETIENVVSHLEMSGVFFERE